MIIITARFISSNKFKYVMNGLTAMNSLSQCQYPQRPWPLSEARPVAKGGVIASGRQLMADKLARADKITHLVQVVEIHPIRCQCSHDGSSKVARNIPQPA